MVAEQGPGLRVPAQERPENVRHPVGEQEYSLMTALVLNTGLSPIQSPRGASHYL